MFLDEKLKKIYDEEIVRPGGPRLEFYDHWTEGIINLINTCLRDMPPLKTQSEKEAITNFRRVNNSFKLFQKKYDIWHIFRQDSFEDFVRQSLENAQKSPNQISKLFKALGWKYPTEMMSGGKSIGVGFIDDLYYGDDDSRPE